VASSEKPTGRNKKVRALVVADRRGDRIFCVCGLFLKFFGAVLCLLSCWLCNLPLIMNIVFALLKFLCWSSLDQTAFKEQTTTGIIPRTQYDATNQRRFQENSGIMHFTKES
jgi:hypothetical protein